MSYKYKYEKYKQKYIKLSTNQIGRGNNTNHQKSFDIETSVKNLMAEHHICGCSLTIVKNFEIVFTSGFGKKEANQKDNITTDTQFLAGSVSKPIFALGIMKLYQDKKIDIDADISKYLTSWSLPKTNGIQNKITLRQILSHTAGTTVHGFAGYKVTDKIPTTVEILNGEPPANSSKVEIDILPGTKFRYSGGGTTVGQLVLCDVLKKDFPTIMDELLFKKMNLSCSYQQPVGKFAIGGNRAFGHIDNKIIEGKYHIYPEMAAAGLWTSSRDLAIIGIEICKGLCDKSKIFKPATIKEMLKPQWVQSKNDAIGLGFFLNIGNNIFGHVGVDEGFVTDITFKKNGIGFVIMINELSNNGFLFMRQLKDIIYTEYEWNFIRYKHKMPDLDQYVGKYVENKNNIQCKVTVQKNKEPQIDNLILHINNYDIDIYHDPDNNTFYANIFNLLVEFRKDTMRMYQNGTINIFHK